jgi:peptide/nickel transport system substrate-binding protein
MIMKQLKEAEKLLSTGKISRRTFLTRLSALGLAAAASPILLSSPAHSSGPKKGGRLIIGAAGGSTTDSLDPSTIPDTMPMHTNWALRNNLVEVDADGKPIPELAEKWEASADAATWYFDLRKGVEFHNGKTLEAQDVIDSINHHRGESSKSAAKGIVDPIKQIKADGKHRVVFVMNEGNADFPFILSDYHLTIQPAGTKGEAFEKGIGTGGYTLVQHEPGVRAQVKRNPNYWKNGRAHFDEVEILGIKDASSRTNALKTGQIHAMNRCEPRTIHLMKKASGVTVLQTSGFKHFSFPMHTDKAPYDDNNVRLALKYAVDRERMVKNVLNGCGSAGNDHPIAKIQRFYNSDLPQRTYDPDKARYHMEKAGLLDHTFTLYASDGAFPGAVDASVLLKESAGKAGIKIKIQQEPADGYWSNVWLVKPWCTSYWYGRATEDWMFVSAYAPDAKWNETRWKHEKFDKLLKEARAELNEDKRRELYYECQRLVSDEGGAIIPMYADLLLGISEKLGHGKVAGNWELDGNRMAERWWFKS